MEITAVALTEALPVIREYYTDIIERYHGRPATPAEVEQTMIDEPSDDILMLLARAGDKVLGCAGLRFDVPPFAEVKRMYVVPAARGGGVGQALLAAAEDVAREHGAVTMRLSTRRDLVEAIALYRKAGYVEVERFDMEDDYVDHSFAKDLLYVTPVDADDARLAGLIAQLDRDLWDRYGNEDLGPSPISPGARFVLACRGQVPVGCVSVQPKGEDFELKRMYVSPAARGTGVAPLLMEAAEAAVLAAGGRRIVLETGVRQPEAIRLYEKSGYARIPNYTPYDQDPLSVCYAKELTVPQTV